MRQWLATTGAAWLVRVDVPGQVKQRCPQVDVPLRAARRFSYGFFCESSLSFILLIPFFCLSDLVILRGCGFVAPDPPSTQTSCVDGGSPLSFFIIGF